MHNQPLSEAASEQKVARFLTWALLALCIITLLPFLGDTLFNTRGEPREAVVALSMLKDGNWVLPVNNGVDLAYKPPFFHWLIALFSLPTGHVTEYTSRLPSALALIVMVMVGFRFFLKRCSTPVAWLMALITLTNFEVHRAGVACRVDMVLTCLMVLSLYLLYQWMERGMKGLPWWGILCLSGAFLTKGPVGAALPCLVVAVFAWTRGRSFWPVLWRMAVVGLLSCVLPLAWYVAAYQQGGEKFWHLVYEENVLRLLGKMSYDSHVNPWTYNVLTVITGFVPYTLLLLLSIGLVKWRKLAATLRTPIKQWGKNIKSSIGKMNDADWFALLSFALIFLFYCLPKSKRSVYLLPIYPFLAYFLARYIIWLCTFHKRVLNGFGWIVASLGTLLTLAFLAVRCGCIPAGLMGRGSHAASNLAMLQALQTAPLGFVKWCIALLPLLSGVLFVKNCSRSTITSIVGCVCCIFFALDGVFQPLVLNTKSDKPLADYIAQKAPKGRIYSFRTDVTPGNPLHPFTINFYLGDRVVPFEAFSPEEGWLIVGNEEITDFAQRYPQYAVTLDKDFHHKSCDDHKMLKFYRFELKK